MTFDFAPGQLGTEIADHDGIPGLAAALSPLSPPPPCAPAHPSDRELAALVRELFTEGTLSWEQLRTLGAVGQLHSLLIEAIADVPPARRVTEQRR
jgi:hypothetical protein